MSVLASGGKVKLWEDREGKKKQHVFPYSLRTTSPSEKNVSLSPSFGLPLATLLLLPLLPQDCLGAKAQENGEKKGKKEK